ncbi:hypothetical protein E3E36_03970 [Thermococcus sp. M36]|uniref:hypothetical protein n=1 Tax=Thermococcus sp. M36 TaxID=1638261 RepID=UPI00143A84A3|nr:hypothetical protein [Thermococcus sp. M36]NJE05310.1 hypothetical protein [Thermococcus sp. M36]
MKKALAVLLIIFIVSSITAYYQTAPQRTAGPDIERLVYNISAGLEKTRGLRFRGLPAVAVISREEAVKRWGPTRQNPQALWLRERLYKMTLLLPANYSLRASEERQTAGWVALVSGNLLYIIRENFYQDPQQAYGVIAHELTHVLQSQNFEVNYPREYDGYLAVRSLVEGDATLSAVLYCRDRGLPVERLSEYTVDPLTNLNFFPYIAGYDFVSYLYRKGGWSLVDEAYSREPSSQKVVMFPELYLKGWKPLSVRANLPEGFTGIYTDRLGAFYVAQVAERAGRSGKEFARAWVGDNATIAVNGTVMLLLWNVTFEDRDTAERFRDVLTKLAVGDDFARFEVSVEGNSTVLVSMRDEE